MARDRSGQHRAGIEAPVARRLRPLRAPTFVVVVVGLLATGLLSWTCYVVNDHNETRLLDLQVKEVGTVLEAAVPSVENPLTAAAAIAAATDGDPARFTAYAAGLVGARGSFTSVALWRLAGGAPESVVALGTPAPPADAAGTGALILAAARDHRLHVVGAFDAPDPHIGYAVAAGGAAVFVVTAATAVHPRQPLKVSRNSAFADLDYALYLGTRADPRTLLGATDIAQLPLRGRVASTATPFGTSTLFFVATPSAELGGSLLNRLDWIVGLVGAAFTLVVAAAAELLARRRDVAQELAAENHRLYGEQRSIAQRLQQALLPAELPSVPGMALAARYLPGATEVDIGGDWHDVITDGHGRFVFVVGDVSGHGIDAATTMASLHYAVRAFAAQGDSPGQILTKLTSLIDVARDGRFATVLCGRVEVGDHRVTMANAGHLAPLLVTGQAAHFVDTPVGPPIGAPATRPYDEVVVPVPDGATLMVFTDGLVERRGESIDAGLERLRTAAGDGSSRPVGDLLGGVVTAMAAEQTSDDTAILGMQWTN